MVVVLRCTHQDPAHMRPPSTVARRMRIAVLIRVRMMNTMCGHPLNRSTFDRQSATKDKRVFDRFRHAITTVRQQTVKTHSNPETSRNPIEHGSGYDGRPAKEKECCDRRGMRSNQENPISPFDFSFFL